MSILKHGPVRFLAMAAVALVAASPSYANITFNVTYGTSITGLSNAVAIETLITNTLAVYTANFSDPITVSLEFDNMASGLGQSSYVEYTGTSYSSFRTALAGDATSANDATAIANLPNTSTDPVLGNTNIDLKSANGRAIGLSTPAATTNVNDPGACFVAGTYDGCIGINFGLTTTGNGTPFPGSYDAQAVLEHEIDEVLGLGSSLLNVSCGGVACDSTTISAFANQISPEDLFRYTLAGSRTFVSGQTCSAITNDAYLSIDGGATQINQFNQSCNGGDFGDWIQHGTAQVQDWAATPGATPSLSTELIALDVVGYDSALPEPATFGLVGGVLLGAAMLRRRLGALSK